MYYTGYHEMPPLVCRLVDFKNLKNNSVLMENESNQQLNENIQSKICLAAEHQDWRKRSVHQTRYFLKLSDF